MDYYGGGQQSNGNKIENCIVGPTCFQVAVVYGKVSMREVQTDVRSI